MLVYFKVGNFKSIKDQIAINFEATAISEHQDANIIEERKTKLLKSVLLYGPNASGKSKILEAFATYRGMILESASYNSTRSLPIQPFRLNNQTIDQPSYFEAEFVIRDKRYRYGFEVNAKNVSKEWLMEVKATTITAMFLRIGQEFQINHSKFVNAEGLETKCNENALYLSVSDQWNAPIAKDIYAWFDAMYIINGLRDAQYKSRTNELFKNQEYKDKILSMIRHADLGINGISVIDISDREKERLQRSGIFTEHELELAQGEVLAKHDVLDDHGNIVGQETFSMETLESEGTKKFYNIIGSLLYAVQNGQFVVIDEFDARFHPLLSKAIIRLFNGETVKAGAQLFAVSHDTALLDKELLRRDQIYFVEKDNFAATKVVNLVEYKNARKDTPYSKNYLEGKYGGIPFIENLENFLNNGEEQKPRNQ